MEKLLTSDGFISVTHATPAKAACEGQPGSGSNSNVAMVGNEFLNQIIPPGGLPIERVAELQQEMWNHWNQEKEQQHVSNSQGTVTVSESLLPDNEENRRAVFKRTVDADVSTRKRVQDDDLCKDNKEK